MAHNRIAIYGGNGFVGTHIAKALSSTDSCVLCVSRTGHKPAHLREQAWSDNVKWCSGDATNPDEKLLNSIDVLICCIGSPPVPTFNQAAYDAQVHSNGTTNQTVIRAAASSNVKRVVLISANLPKIMRRESFGYALGKKMSEDAATQFAKSNAERSAIIFRPGMIYGTRHNAKGRAIHLAPFFAPLGALVPSQFTCVERLSNRVVEFVNQEASSTKLQVINAADI